MRRAALACLAAGLLSALAAPASAGAIALPSGRTVSFADMIRGEAGPAGPTVRFRFIEEDLGAIIDTRPYDELEADMKFLCENYALERIADTGPQPAAVIVSISDRPVPFGAPSPEARQVFEAYRPENGSCIWEGF